MILTVENSSHDTRSLGGLNGPGPSGSQLRIDLRDRHEHISSSPNSPSPWARAGPLALRISTKPLSFTFDYYILKKSITISPNYNFIRFFCSNNFQQPHASFSSYPEVQNCSSQVVYIFDFQILLETQHKTGIAYKRKRSSKLFTFDFAKDV